MRVLCLPYTHTLSHISRPLLIAQELRNRGHSIVFSGDSPCQHFIEEEGFEVLPLYQIDPDVLFGRIRDGRLKFVEDAELELMIASDIDVFRQTKPDLVLTDGRFSAPISTAACGLRHAAIVNVSSTKYRALPYIPFFNWIPKQLVGENTHLKKMLNRVNLSVEMQVFDNASGIFKKLSRRHQLSRKVTATNCLTGKDLTLMADIEEYFPTRNLAEDHHYIGPLTWKSSMAIPNWWPPKKNGDLLIYITMGTTWMGGSFSKIYELVRSHQITAIITTGGQAKILEKEGLQTVEGLIYVEDFVDGDMVMKECDIVVCHGGNGTIYQALQHGKPIIGIPTIPDQKFNMRRVKSLGVGETMTIKELANNPEKLFQLVNKIARDSKYLKKAQKFQADLMQLKPAKNAADLIEKYFCNR